MALQEPDALCFVDTETTGLGPDRRVWEVAIIRRPLPYADEDPRGHDQVWTRMVLDVDLSTATPEALRVGGFYERHPEYTSEHPLTAQIASSARDVAAQVEGWTRNAVLVGKNPAFDAGGLDALLRGTGFMPAWDTHHLYDVSQLTLGWLCGRGVAFSPVPFSSREMEAALGLPPQERVHTALDDAMRVRDVWDRLYHGI